MLKYVCGGIGMTSIGLGLQPYIKALQSYSLWFILGGIFLFMFPLLRTFFRRISPFFINKFASHKDIYLTGSNIEDKYGIKPFELKQRIEKGMPAYIQNTPSYRTDNLRAVSDRDLIACEVWGKDANSMVKQWLFKTEDIKKYIKTT